MEMHLASRHNQVFINGLFYSELQLKLTGLLEIPIQMRKCNAWKCLDYDCRNDYSTYATMSENTCEWNRQRMKSTFMQKLEGSERR
jgi:hypothetical protein